MAEDRTPRGLDWPAGDGERRLGGERAGSAFLLTSLITAAGTTLAAMLGMYGVAGWNSGRDLGFVVIAFFVFWAITVLAGMAVGLPMLIGLRRLGLHRRPEALLAAGLVGGLATAIALASAVLGPAVRGDPFIIALGAGSGLAAGALWWLFATGLRRRNG